MGSICVTGLEPRDSRTLLVRTFRESGNQDVRGFTTLSRTARIESRKLRLAARYKYTCIGTHVI